MKTQKMTYLALCAGAALFFTAGVHATVKGNIQQNIRTQVLKPCPPNAAPSGSCANVPSDKRCNDFYGQNSQNTGSLFCNGSPGNCKNMGKPCSPSATAPTS